MNSKGLESQTYKRSWKQHQRNQNGSIDYNVCTRESYKIMLIIMHQVQHTVHTFGRVSFSKRAVGASIAPLQGASQAGEHLQHKVQGT